MAQQGKSDELVTLQELAVSNAYEIAALVAVLERKGLVTQARGAGGDHAAAEEEGAMKGTITRQGDTGAGKV